MILNALMPLIIVVVVTLLIYAMIKYKSPLIYGLFAVVIAFGGVYSSFVCYEYYTQKSETRGTLVEVDPYEDFDIYNVDIEGIAWHKDVANNIYYLEKTYKTVVDFDGTDKQFNVLVNGQPCYSNQSTAGKLRSQTALRVKDVDGQHMTTINVIVNMTFYSNKVVLLIQTDATDSTLTYLKQNCQINGLNIRVLENIGNHYTILTQEAV